MESLVTVESCFYCIGLRTATLAIGFFVMIIGFTSLSFGVHLYTTDTTVSMVIATILLVHGGESIVCLES